MQQKNKLVRSLFRVLNLKSYEAGKQEVLDDMEEIVHEMLHGGHLSYIPNRNPTTDEQVIEQTMSSIITYLVRKRWEDK